MSGLPPLAARIGRPLSPIYSALMKARQAAYSSGLLSSLKIDVPVISIGNLTMGGSGKTPMVMAVAKLIQKEGRLPAVISRGYGGKAKGNINLVSDGQNLLMNASDAGDEPYLLARSLPGIPVVTGPKRILTAPYAVRELGAEIIIMDDGFQHLALKRDLDLVLFKAPELLGDGRVFPGGYLREPVSALLRASAFVITCVEEENEDKVGEFAGYLEKSFPGRPVFKVRHRLGTPINIKGNDLTDVSADDQYFAFCGLADPENFRQNLERAGYKISGFQAFPDHHSYSPADIEMLVGRADGRTILTTEKDIVKLEGLKRDGDFYSIPLRIDIPEVLRRYLLTL